MKIICENKYEFSMLVRACSYCETMGNCDNCFLYEFIPHEENKECPGIEEICEISESED